MDSSVLRRNQRNPTQPYKEDIIYTQLLYYCKRLGLEVPEAPVEASVPLICPLCGAPDTFTVDRSADSWSCAACSKAGNSYGLEMLLSGSSCEEAFAAVVKNITEMQAELGRGLGPDDFRCEYSEYYYSDLFGNRVLRVVRRHMNWLQGKDLIAAPFLIKANGEWEENPKTVPAILYNLPEVVQAESVVITESELAANAVTKALNDAPGKWAATCWPLALGDWPVSCSQYLLDKQVFLVPENLDSSRYRLARAADALVGVAASVKMAVYPELGSVIDFTDFITKSPCVVTELLAAFEAGMLWASDDGFVITSAGELLENPEIQRHWVVEGLLPGGGMGLLIGDPKIGKSTLARQLAVAVADGKEFLGRKVTSGVALYIAMEGSTAEIKEHLCKLGLENRENVLILTGRTPNPAQLTSIVKQRAVTLVVFDTLAKCLQVKSLNDYGSVLKAMQTVEPLARELGVHLLFIHHTKGNGEALGSTAITGGPDVNIYLAGEGDKRFIRTEQRGGIPFYGTPLKFDLVHGSYSLE